jgi:hypothetical protein
MSGIEPLILASLAGIGEAAAGVGTAIGSAASSVGSAVGIGSAASAGEAALIASAAEAAGVAVPGAVSTGQALTAAGTLASTAGAGAQLLSKPPSLDLPSAPTRDTARTEADARSAMLKRRGRAATLLTGAGGVSSNPTLGSPSLTGTA